MDTVLPEIISKFTNYNLKCTTPYVVYIAYMLYCLHNHNS